LHVGGLLIEEIPLHTTVADNFCTQVSLEQIYSLNVELFSKPKPNLRSSSRKTIATPSSKAKPSQLRAVENISNTPTHLPEKSSIASRVRDRQNAQPPPLSYAFSKVNSEGIGGQPVPPQQLPPSKEGPPPAAAIAPRLRDRQNAQPPPSSSSAFSKVDSEGDRGQPVLPPPVPQQQLPPPKERPPPAKSRKSNCVKEVERLKKNRDERRAKQAEQALHRNEGYDASTPQWEFFQKIRECRSKIDFNPLVGDEQVSKISSISVSDTQSHLPYFILV